MKNSNYQCVNCQLNFDQQANYIGHYKSQHHRYNIKRKLIGLPPVSFQEYHLQCQDQKTSKNSVQQEFHCEICSKKFMNSGTYKQHIASKKHKYNRAQLKAPQKKILSKSSSSSDFSIIGAQRPETCLFCNLEGTQSHLRQQHNFPPFQTQCINYQGLVKHIKQKILTFQCIFCHLKFNSEQSVKQHMNDLGHNKIDIQNFREFQKFYMWKIEQTSSQQQQQITQNNMQMENQQQFQELTHPTLEQIERKRMEKIQFTNTGAIINGKQVGYRHLKKYYKQYLTRQIKNPREKYQPALQVDKSQWKIAALNNRFSDRPPKISQIVNFR